MKIDLDKCNGSGVGVIAGGDQNLGLVTLVEILTEFIVHNVMLHLEMLCSEYWWFVLIQYIDSNDIEKLNKKKTKQNQTQPIKSLLPL